MNSGTNYCFILLALLVFIICLFAYLPFDLTVNEKTVKEVYVKKKDWLNELSEATNFTGKIYALVFYGRQAQVSILIRYLEKNLKINGGVLEKIVFNVKTTNKDDLNYLDSILNQNKSYYEKRIFPSNHDFKGVYSEIDDNDLIFKIDDDIVFIAPNTFENMLKEYLTKNLIVLSANVINHPILSHVHARLMAITPFFEIRNYTWIKVENTTYLDNTECKFGDYGPFSLWWRNGRCAAIVHESFLDNAKKNSLDIYNFLKWDFHQTSYERWSINFVLFKGKYVKNLKEEFPKTENDETAISCDIPRKYGRHSYSLGSAIVVHFSYVSQYDYLKNTFLLKKYENLSTDFLSVYYK